MGEDSIDVEPSHIAQLYSNDTELIERAAAFVRGGLIRGELALVVATEAHRKALSLHLANSGLDVKRARGRGSLTFFDAEKTREAISSDGRVDEGRLRAVMGSVILDRIASTSTGRVRVYVEIGDLLCREGLLGEATRLERFWNRLRDFLPFSLLCACGMEPDTDECSLIDAISRTHAQVYLPKRVARATVE
jgi:DcmR-like sensory protein